MAMQEVAPSGKRNALTELSDQGDAEYGRDRI
jgi:hypothetical protein